MYRKYLVTIDGFTQKMDENQLVEFIESNFYSINGDEIIDHEDNYVGLCIEVNNPNW